MGENADRADVRRVLDGDPSAFAGIVRRWQGPLVNLAYRYFRDRAVAEEMAQEAFLRAYRFLDRWRDDAAFSTWLFTVASNLYRSKMRRHRPPEVSVEALGPLRGSADTAADLEAADTHEAVRRAVTRLPAKYRDTLILFYFHGMDVEETGRTLGLPQGTVKARLHRGRELLRRRLPALLGSPRQAEAS